jgi:Xaa-Pro aminopeptidase
MGGTHAEACRRECANALSDVRHSRNGRYAEVMVERIKELKLERGRIGLVEVDARHKDYLPVNQYNVLRQGLPDAELVFTEGFLHELLVVHSEEELACVRKAGVLCQRAMEAMVARAKPGVPEYELRAAAGAAILDGAGDIDFLIIGSTPMDDPAMVFGNPRPSQRKLKKGDIINMELAAGSPLRSARPSRSASRPRWCAGSGRRSRSRATTRSSPRSGRVTRPTICGSRAGFFATRGCSRAPLRCTGSTS